MGLFNDGIDAAVPRVMGREFGCAVLLYVAVLVQLVIAFVIFTSKNFVPCLGTCSCPAGYVHSTGWVGCFSPSLREEMWNSDCRRLEGAGNVTTGPPALSELRRQLSLSEPEQFVYWPEWFLIPELAHYPAVILLCFAIVGVAWLLFAWRDPERAFSSMPHFGMALFVVSGCFGTMQYLGDLGSRWLALCPVPLAFLFCFGACSRQVDPTQRLASRLLAQAWLGLRANGRAFAVLAGVQVVWALYFVQWTAALVGREAVLQVDVCGRPHRHTVISSFWTDAHFVVCLLWVTRFAQNVNLILVTTSVAGWYFQPPAPSRLLLQTLSWSVGVQGGDSALASAIVGLSEMRRPTALSALNPLQWVLWALVEAASTRLKILQTPTRFGVIAMTFSGKHFHESVGTSGQLLRSWLHHLDHDGSRNTATASYGMGLLAGLLAWAVADGVQGMVSLGMTLQFFGFLVAVALLLPFPFIALLVLLWLDSRLFTFTWTYGQLEMVNSAMAALFMAVLTRIILSVIFKIVAGAMDALIFCVAVEADNQGRQARFAELYAAIEEEWGIQLTAAEPEHRPGVVVAATPVHTNEPGGDVPP